MDDHAISYKGGQMLMDGQPMSREEQAAYHHAMREELRGGLADFVRRPLSDGMSNIRGGKLTLEAALGDLSRRVQSGMPSPMPADIYAAMQLSEYYMETEGDLAQTIYAPAEIAINGLEVTCPDPDVQRQAREIVYDVLYLEEVLREMEICSQIYGQAFPLEEWNGQEIRAIHFLNPTTVWTDRSISVGINESTQKRLSGWDEPAISEVHPTGEYDEKGFGQVFQVNPEYITPFYAPKMDWKYYAMPPLRPTFRSIGTRQILDELVRATMEGFINQLWIFKLGTDDKAALPADIRLFRTMIETAVTKRTGAIVWDHALEVEQHTPNNLDQLMGNQKYMELTAKIMADRGISLRLISGTPTERDATDMEMDVQILIERLKTHRSKLLRWANYLIAKVAKKRGWSTPVTLRFPNVPMEDQLRIRLKIVPMYQTGVLSAKTALTEAGYDYDEEMANKGAEDKEKLMPPTSYVQQVVGPDGQTRQAPRPGRRVGADDEEPREVQAAEEDAWPVLMSRWWDDLSGGRIPPTVFIDWMRRANELYAGQAYSDGYFEAGGTGVPDSTRLAEALDFNASRLGGFLDALEAAQGTYPGSLERRAFMYTDIGLTIPYMRGMFQAMRERGARYWRRILHPELSRSGPCEICIADARLVHSIDEEFTDHPNGVCTEQEVAFFAGEVGEIPMITRVPWHNTPRRPGAVSEVR